MITINEAHFEWIHIPNSTVHIEMENNTAKHEYKSHAVLIFQNVDRNKTKIAMDLSISNGWKLEVHAIAWPITYFYEP